MEEILWWGLGLATFVLLISSSIRTIPKVYFGIVTRFGKRTGMVIHEGLSFVWPFVDSVDLVSTELVPLNFTVEFTTRDQVALTIRGALQYSASPEIRDRNGRNVFVAVSPQSRESGLMASVQGLLSNLGGLHDSSDFIGKKGTLELILRCILELQILPHDEAGVSTNEMFVWYQKNALGVSQRLNEARRSFSQTEKNFGIDIATVTVAEVKFPKEIEDAQQDKREADLRFESLPTFMSAAAQVREALPNLTDSEIKDFLLTFAQEGVQTIILNTKGGGLDNLSAALLSRERK
jgi:hypothetical protein